MHRLSLAFCACLVAAPLFCGLASAAPQKFTWYEEATRWGFTSLLNQVTSLPLQPSNPIPSWINGTFIRNGPGQFEYGPTRFKHPFDGFAMLHGFKISAGDVAYSNKFVATTQRKAALRTGTLAGYKTFAGLDPCESMMGHAQSMFMFADEVNVQTVRVGSTLVALGENPNGWSFDPESLDTFEQFVLWPDMQVPGVAAYPASHSKPMPTLELPAGMGSAHMHYMQDGSYLSRVAKINVDPMGKDTTIIYRIPPGKTPDQKEILGEWPEVTDGPHYVHSFGYTEQYIVVPEYPAVIDKMKMFKGDTVISGFQWLPDQGTNMTVLHVASKTMKRFRCAENFFAFHTVNMFVNDNGVIVLDMLTFDDLSLLFALFINSAQPRRTVGNVPYGVLRRLTIDPNADPATYVVKSQILDNYGYELPRINDAYDGKPYTYFYALTTQRPFSFPMDVIAKVDVVTGKKLLFQEEGLSLGEAVFIQDPNDSKEDAGVLVTTALDVAAGFGMFLVINATNMQEISRAALPHHMPFVFHGNFYPADTLN